MMEPLINVKEAAGLLHVAEMTIRRWTNSGLLSCYRVGGKRERRFRIQDLQDFLHQRSGLAISSQGLVPLGTRDIMLPDGSHFSHLSASEQESRKVGISYIQQGLSRKETVLLVTSAAKVAQYTSLLELQGINVKEATSRHLLHIGTGEDTPEAMVAFIGYKMAVANGPFRLLGDMTWVQAKGWQLEDLRQLEELGRRLPKTPGHLFLCQYPLACFSGQELMMAVETHSYTLYNNALQKSPYFIH